MHTVFKFNWGIINNASKYNLAGGLNLKKPIKVSLSLKQCLLSKYQWKYKKILDMKHTRTQFTMPGKSVYANLQDVFVAL